MCTVAFIPSKDVPVLVSLRDESPLRPKAIPPQQYISGSGFAYYPLDKEGGGTWVGIHNSGPVVVLLNGAFVAHQRSSTYLYSRGKLVTQMLASENPVDIWNETDLHQIEPHTLIVFHQHRLFHLAWDSEKKHLIEKDTNTAHVWSSATLYQEAEAMQRNRSILEFLQSNYESDRIQLLQFFKKNQDLINGFLINREEKVKTLSMSHIAISSTAASFHYHELDTDKIYHTQIDWTSKQ